MIEGKIEPGDMFIKRWGTRDITWVALPRTLNSAKQHWLCLHLPRGTVHTSWHLHRDEVTPYYLHRRRKQMQFIGTIPVAWLEELAKNWTLRTEES